MLGNFWDGYLGFIIWCPLLQPLYGMKFCNRSIPIHSTGIKSLGIKNHFWNITLARMWGPRYDNGPGCDPLPILLYMIMFWFVGFYCMIYHDISFLLCGNPLPPNWSLYSLRLRVVYDFLHGLLFLLTLQFQQACIMKPVAPHKTLRDYTKRMIWINKCQCI